MAGAGAATIVVIPVHGLTAAGVAGLLGCWQCCGTLHPTASQLSALLPRTDKTSADAAKESSRVPRRARRRCCAAHAAKSTSPAPAGLDAFARRQAASMEQSVLARALQGAGSFPANRRATARPAAVHPAPRAGGQQAGHAADGHHHAPRRARPPLLLSVHGMRRAGRGFLHAHSQQAPGIGAVHPAQARCRAYSRPDAANCRRIRPQACCLSPSPERSLCLALPPLPPPLHIFARLRACWFCRHLVQDQRAQGRAESLPALCRYRRPAPQADGASGCPLCGGPPARWGHAAPAPARPRPGHHWRAPAPPTHGKQSRTMFP